MALFSSDYTYLALLRQSPFEPHARGGWRFGTRRIADSVAERLVASGRAEICGRRLQLTHRQPGDQ